ncbi:MAG TPA: hypothetical protein VFU21_04275 [Kofleriaceae bacterium]|nr:hypothetical protein [Kofleriaceae bacterium]
MLRSSLFALAVFALLAGRAVAGPADDTPWFTLADRQDGGSWIGGAITWAPLEDAAFVGGGSILRLDVAGQYFTASGLGGYGVLPVARLSADEQDATAIGNLEGGALYALGAGPAGILLRLGLTAPTAPASDADGSFATILAAYTRPGDFALAWPRTIWARASTSAIVQLGPALVRGDAGLDVAVAALDDDLDSPDPLLRLNGAAGLDLGLVAAFAELSAITGIGSDDDGGIYEQDVATTAALSAHLRLPAIEPSLAVGLPLDSDVRDLIPFFVSAGVKLSLP